LLKGFKIPGGDGTYETKFLGYKKDPVTNQWSYVLQGNAAIAFNSRLQAPGQGNPSPVANFPHHVMVLFDFRNIPGVVKQGSVELYDPSYGAIYSGRDENEALQQFQDKAIVAFFTAKQRDGFSQWSIKRPTPGELQLRNWFPNPVWFPVKPPS
jgi:hypothetical protein